jgi:hypothetical protein
MRQLLTALAFLFSFTVSVFAQAFSPESIVALKDRIATFEKAMLSWEINGIVDIMPPKIKGYIMTRGNVTEPQLKDAMAKQFATTAKDVTIMSFIMDVDKADTKTLSDGTNYLLIPTLTKMDVKDYGKLLSTSSTLAFVDGDKWYLLRVADQEQIQILNEVYPAFKDVTFPQEKTEDIKE